jgi:3-hydroxybutyryl-CoA dehydrogenase/5-formyl-3-hydroxy-2-methylpyridine 4-carboxylate dehydrogenase
VPAETVVASDTSGIPITKLQAFISNPARVVGMHWSNPPHIIPMIEVIAGEETAPKTVEFVANLIRELNLLPVIVKKDVPGFVENRVLYALLREAVDLVESGVIDPEDLDTCVSWGIGYKLGIVGPMALLDMAGLDIYESVSSFLNAELATRADVAPFVKDRTAAGKLGMKTGGGVYGYTPERIAALQKARAEKFVAVRKVLEGRA